MKTGDRVICIDATAHGKYLSPSLIKNREYIIYNILECDCGRSRYDVGLKSDLSYMICRCGNKFSTNSDIHWASSKRFAKVKEQYKVIHMDIKIEEPVLN